MVSVFIYCFASVELLTAKVIEESTNKIDSIDKKLNTLFKSWQIRRRSENLENQTC